MKFTSILKSILKWSLVTIGFFILEPIVLIAIIPLFPIYIFRLFVILLSKIFRPELSRMISGFSACAASDGIYTKPNYTVLTFFFESRRVDVDKHRELMMKHLVTRKRPNGELHYPEMSQYVSYWLGFPFWRNDPDFDISNHVMIYEGSQDHINWGRKFDENDMMKISNDLLTKPYPKNKSPWEMLIIPNARSQGTKEGDSSEQTVIVFKFHHTLGKL